MAAQLYRCVLMDALRRVIEVAEGRFVSEFAAELWGALCADRVQHCHSYELRRGDHQVASSMRPFGVALSKGDQSQRPIKPLLPRCA